MIPKEFFVGGKRASQVKYPASRLNSEMNGCSPTGKTAQGNFHFAISFSLIEKRFLIRSLVVLFKEMKAKASLNRSVKTYYSLF